MAERNTPMRDGELIAAKIEDGTKIEAGTIVMANAAGYAVPGATAASQTALGRAEETVDNTGGADGAKAVVVRRGVFLWANSAADAVTQAYVGKTVYIEDAVTVCKTSTGKSAAGKCLGIETAGVWVEMR